jgi:hypothetical protein
VVLCVLDPPLDEIRRRLRDRNADLPGGTFHITEARLVRAVGHVQRPTPEEMAQYDRSGC